MHGMGDNIYIRPFIKEVRKPAVIRTPWPQIYVDIPGVQVIPKYSVYRTQRKNESRFKEKRDPTNGRYDIIHKNIHKKR
jgi:hypothetical protein